MSKILILLLTIVTAVPVASAQAPAVFTSSVESLLCADVVSGNSVVAPFFGVDAIDLEGIDRGGDVNLPIRVLNANPFPVQNVNVHLRLFKVADSAGQAMAPQLYSTQAVDTHLTLASGESVELNHTFTIPTSLTNGTYHLSTYVESNQRFPLSGTQAYETDAITPLEFTLTEGQPSGTVIDRTSVQINNVEHTFPSGKVSATSSSAVVSGIDTTQIAVTVENITTMSPTIGTFSWETYIGDQPNPVALTDSQTRSIKLAPGTQTVMSYQLLNPQPIDYTLVGTLSTENSPDQTVVISFGEDEAVIARPPSADPIDFAMFANNTTATNSTDLLFCYTPANLLPYQHPGLNFKVVSAAAGVIGEYSVDLSDTTYSSVSQADRFSFPSAPGVYTVEVSLLDADTVIGTSSLRYFNEPSESLVPVKIEQSTIVIAVVAGLLGLLTFGLLFFRRSFTKLNN